MRTNRSYSKVACLTSTWRRNRKCSVSLVNLQKTYNSIRILWYSSFQSVSSVHLMRIEQHGIHSPQTPHCYWNKRISFTGICTSLKCPLLIKRTASDTRSYTSYSIRTQKHWRWFCIWCNVTVHIRDAWTNIIRERSCECQHPDNRRDQVISCCSLKMWYQCNDWGGVLMTMLGVEAWLVCEEEHNVEILSDARYLSLIICNFMQFMLSFCPVDTVFFIKKLSKEVSDFFPSFCI